MQGEVTEDSAYKLMCSQELLGKKLDASWNCNTRTSPLQLRVYMTCILLYTSMAFVIINRRSGSLTPYVERGASGDADVK